MPEYIYTNLPQYVKVNSRTEFSSSVVSSGAVLLFSEDGTTLTAKLPDGSFVNVGGSGGTDVSSTTAEAGDVLSGKIFFTSGGVMTSGTIPTVSASLSANVATVPSGYIAASQTLTVPLASSATVSGGIVTIPAGYVASDYTVSAGGGSATDFYKCVTVTSGGSTWTGNKAVLSGGKYSYESAVTSGLSYGSGFIPTVGGIYDDGALIQVSGLWSGIPTQGMVFYAPLSASANAAETGQSFTITGSPVFASYLGISAAYFSGSDVIEAANTNLPYSESPYSVSLWVNIASNPNGDNGILSIGYDSNGALMAIMYNATGIGLSGHGPGYGWDNEGAASITFDGTWHHLAIVFGQGESGSRPTSLYLDGTLVKSGAFLYNDAAYGYTPKLFLGSYYGNATYVPNLTGYLAAVRIYNRALSAAEIGDLAAEFTPTAP